MNTHEQRHRGSHLNDKALFSGEQLLHLRAAAHDFCWLLDRSYARHSVIQLVGDHYQLTNRQRLAISRAACSTASRESRAAKCRPIERINNQSVVIDGFNLLITIETALAGGLLLRCCDGCIRDMASVHGSYKQVHETRHALELIGNVLQSFAPDSVLWLFDKPVSNSGRLAKLVRDCAKVHHWNWRAASIENPDQAILNSHSFAITSDSAVLDGDLQWVNLVAFLVPHYFPDSWLIDFLADA
jgi:hypothetical protein